MNENYIDSGCTVRDCWLLTVDCWLWVKKLKIARIICWQLDSTLRPTMKRGLDIIPASPALILFLILSPDLILPNEFLRHDWLSVDQGVINLNINALIMQSP